MLMALTLFLCSCFLVLGHVLILISARYRNRISLDRALEAFRGLHIHERSRDLVIGRLESETDYVVRVMVVDISTVVSKDILRIFVVHQDDQESENGSYRLWDHGYWLVFPRFDDKSFLQNQTLHMIDELKAER